MNRTPIEQANNKANKNNSSIVQSKNGNNIKSGANTGVVADIDLNNNITITGQMSNQPNHNNYNNNNNNNIIVPVTSSSSSSSSLSPSSCTQNDLVVPKNTSPLNDSSQDNCETKTSASDGISDDAKINETKFKHLDGSSPITPSNFTPILNDKDYEGRINVTHNELASITKSSSSPSNVPVIKSALKKRSNINSVDAPLKHNRSVSFNQTVIVFCEEIETSSPSEHCDPPIGYQDSNLDNTYEPPEKYCDLKQTNHNHKTDSVRNDLGIFNKIVGENASNLTDEQLFGLLENESLLQSFRINCDDFSEDDDFPLDQLNSSQSYLCHDAISDPESDSESSLAIKESREAKAITSASSSNNPPAQTSAAHANSNKESRQQPTNQNRQAHQESNINTSKPPEANKSDLNNSHADRHTCSQPKSNHPQQRLPARMKVSTVDNNHPRRQQQQRTTARQEDDRELESNAVQNSSKIDQRQSITTSSALSELAARSCPMMIKQSNIDSIPVSKPLIVKNNFSELNTKQLQNKRPTANLGYSSLQTTMIKTADQMRMNDPNQDKLSKQESSAHQQTKMQNQNQAQTGTSTGNVRAQIIQSQSACHICKALESVHDQTTSCTDVKNPITLDGCSNSVPTSTNQQHQLGQTVIRDQYHGSISIVPNQPVLNPSCASCREASIQQRQVIGGRNGSQATASQMSDATKPVAYQLVYFVDQNGNRVRALQVVGPAPREVDLAEQPARQIFIAPNGYRFPNPNSMSGQQYFRIPFAGQAVYPRAVQNFSNKNAQHAYNLEHDSLSINQDQQRNTNQLAFLAAGSQINSAITPGLRNQTVYYVRQPLGAQNIRQTFDSTESGSRSFPDPHEIRRLDGLRGPTTNLNLSQKFNPGNVLRSFEPNEMNHQHLASMNGCSDSKKDDLDDPTFGFSKRPAVKVVSTSANQSQGAAGSQLHHNVIGGFNKNVTLKGVPTTMCKGVDSQAGIFRPVSLIVNGSQTLDRRNMNRNQQSQLVTKENIPSTSSMSNLNATLNSYQDGVIGSIKRQEQRISENQVKNLTCGSNDSKTKVLNEQDRNRSDGNNRVILNNQGAERQVLLQGLQASSQYGNESFPPSQNRKAQEPEIAYTMNI